MSKKIITILIILLVINMSLSLWSLYNQRKVQARICWAVASAYDRIMTKIGDATYDKATTGLHSNCVDNSLFLLPGFSRNEISRLIK